jgi:ribulose-5-phosphate 4-epimerase/fuculose-1-phosphate aldolase
MSASGKDLKMEKPVVKIKKQLATYGEIKDTMLQACKIMDAFGLVQGFGHVSSRLPGSGNFLVTARKALGMVEERDLVVVDAAGKVVDGSATPFAEIYMHLGIYQKRPDIGAICRFHSEMTSVFGILNRSVRVVHAGGYLLGPEVRVLSSANLGHTPEIIEQIGDLLSDSYGIIFRGNGAATLGTNIIDACVRALILEESANLQYKASLLGEPVYLSMEEINRRNQDYLNLPDYDVYYRAWEYYVGKIS